MYTEETILNYGKYKSHKLRDIPEAYFLRIHKNNSSSDPELRQYIESRYGVKYHTKNIVLFTREIRIVCDRIPFPTKADARYELQKIKYSRENIVDPPTRVYECKKCGGWHLTSEPYKTFEPPRLDPRCNKIPFNSFKKACNEVRRIRRMKRNRGRTPTRVYECEFCGKWHLTSMKVSYFKRKRYK